MTKRILNEAFKKNLFEGFGKIVFEMDKCKRKNRTIRSGMKAKYMELLERKRIYEERIKKIYV